MSLESSPLDDLYEDLTNTSESFFLFLKNKITHNYQGSVETLQTV